MTLCPICGAEFKTPGGAGHFQGTPLSGLCEHCAEAEEEAAAETMPTDIEEET